MRVILHVQIKHVYKWMIKYKTKHVRTVTYKAIGVLGSEKYKLHDLHFEMIGKKSAKTHHFSFNRKIHFSPYEIFLLVYKGKIKLKKSFKIKHIIFGAFNYRNVFEIKSHVL